MSRKFGGWKAHLDSDEVVGAVVQDVRQGSECVLEQNDVVFRGEHLNAVRAEKVDCSSCKVRGGMEILGDDIKAEWILRVVL